MVRAGSSQSRRRDSRDIRDLIIDRFTLRTCAKGASCAVLHLSQRQVTIERGKLSRITHWNAEIFMRQLRCRETIGNRQGRMVLWLLAGCGLLSAAGLWLVADSGGEPFPEEVTPLDLERAMREFRFLQRREPDRTELLQLLAENALRQNRFPAALACLALIPATDSCTGAAARRLETQICLRAGLAGRLEAAAKDLLQTAQSGSAVPPADLQMVEEMLVFLLSLEDRPEERQLLLNAIAARRSLDALLTKQLHFPALLASGTAQQNQRLQEFLKQTPDDPHLVSAHVRYLLATGRAEDAETRANELLAAHPADLKALAVALECRFERQALTEFLMLLDAAPDFQLGEPWLLTQMRAEGAIRAGDRARAKRCFEHLVSADPSNPLYLQALAGVVETDTPEGAAERSRLLQRALLLAELRLTLAESHTDIGALRAIAEAARKLGMSRAVQDFERLAMEAADSRGLQRRSEQ